LPPPSPRQGLGVEEVARHADGTPVTGRQPLSGDRWIDGGEGIYQITYDLVAMQILERPIKIVR
jgi:hypothetical protein